MALKKSNLLIVVCLLCFLGCSVADKKVASMAPNSFKQQLIKYQALSKTQPQLAIRKIENLVASYPENNLTDDALFLNGKLLTKIGKTNAAIKSYSKILSSKYTSGLDGKTILALTKLHISNDDIEEALKVCSYIDRYELSNPKERTQIEEQRAPLFLVQEDYFNYLMSAQSIISSKSTSRSTKLKFYNKGLSVLKIKLYGQKNKRVLAEPTLTNFHPTAALNLAEYHFENENTKAAMSVISKYNSILTSPLLKNRKQELIQRANALENANANVLGVLIPLSGRYQSVGQQILNGLEYALDVWNKRGKKNFSLAILDTNAEPERLKLAFDELIKKDKPIAIIGGLVGKTAEALIKKSDEYKVPSLILSQKNGIVAKSRYSFQSANSISSYTDFMARLAKEIGYKKIAILKSNKNFSNQYAELFQKSIDKYGGEAVQVITYDMAERYAIPNAIKKLIHLHTKEGREEEYDLAFETWKEKNKSKRNRDLPRLEELLDPKIEFDALVIADGPKNSGLIASTLAYFDVENVPLIGTHLWNNTSFLVRGQRFVEGALFAHPYFEPSVLNSQCGKDYFRLYSENLTNYSYKGLEAGLIFKTVFDSNKTESRSALLSALQRTSALSHPCLTRGVQREDHNFSAPLTPLTVQNNSIVVFDPENYNPKPDQDPET